MTRFRFHVVALLALWGGKVIADQVQLGDLTYSINGDSVIIMDYRESATGSVVIPDALYSLQKQRIS